jgi:hypothetical protein
MKRIISAVLRLFLAIVSITILYTVLKNYYYRQQIDFPEYFNDLRRVENTGTIVTSIIMVNTAIYMSVNAIRDLRKKHIILWPMFIIFFIAVVMRSLLWYQFDLMSIGELIFTIFCLLVILYFMVSDYIWLFWIKRKRTITNQ